MKLLRNMAVLAPLLAVLVVMPTVQAATSPSLGTAASFAILSSTYTNTAGGTTINGDVGYTTPPAVAPTVTGTTHAADATYTQAGIDQNAALSNLNSQACTFSFAAGAINLATDTTHGPIGVYTPGVYCVTGAASVGGALTLSGSGTTIFRMTGALTTTAGSTVQFTDGAAACDLWWTPTQATTLGANSTFAGTDISAAGITIGSTVTWSGRALAFGGTVTTAATTLSVPTCTTTPTTPGTTTPTTPGAPGTPGNTTANSTTPGLPNTGLSAQQTQNYLLLAIPVLLVAGSASVYYIRNRT